MENTGAPETVGADKTKMGTLTNKNTCKTNSYTSVNRKKTSLLRTLSIYISVLKSQYSYYNISFINNY